MENRKEKEVEYYDKKAEELLKKSSEERSFADFEGFEPQSLASFKFFYRLIEENCRDKAVLDYGCGNGLHSFYPMECGARKVVGIDLSEKSLTIARQRAKKKGMEDKVEFLKRDCEKTEFPDDSFDLILDGGTFSSLDLKEVYPELVRILKPTGVLIGIETFGHNPLANLKRKFNKITGKRTGWAAEHIFQKRDLEGAKNYFGEIKTYFFHLISFIFFPFLNLPGVRIILKIAEMKEKILLKIPFFRKYTFKVVFIFKKPKK